MRTITRPLPANDQAAVPPAARPPYPARLIASFLLGFALLVSNGTAAASTDEVPSCLAKTPSAPWFWTYGRWTTAFGERHPATAVGVQPQDALPFQYYRFGDPAMPPLVLLMGHGSSMMQWDPRFLLALSSCFEVYMFDELGLGLSAFPAQVEESRLQAMTWDDMAVFVNRAVDAIRASDE